MIDKNLKIYDSICTGCSACTESCYFPDELGQLPIKIINNEKGLNVPRINKETCVNCNLCYKSCPIEDKLEKNYNIDFPEVIESYFGYSLDNNHRYNAPTAGIITEFGSYLLNNNIVDCVISCKQNTDNNIETIISDNEYDLKDTKGSIYRQVSLLNNIISRIKLKNYKRILFIGLPCHIEGIKTLQKKNKYLRKCTVYTAGIFCKQTKTDEFSKVIRKILKDENSLIRFRGNGWPGKITINNKKIAFNNAFTDLLWSASAFTPAYCYSCSEPLATNADISIGDAWIPKYLKDKEGSSLFTANSAFAKNILKEMKDKKIIHLEKVPFDEILESQNKNAVLYKREHQKYRTNIFSKENIISEKPSIKYRMRTHWIKTFKIIIEFLYRSKIIYISKFLPKLLIKFNAVVLKFLKIDR
jgi:coenzyme F420 hydrogenase subunit beta